MKTVTYPEDDKLSEEDIESPFNLSEEMFDTDTEGAFYVFFYMYGRMEITKLNCSTLMNLLFEKILFPYVVRVR